MKANLILVDDHKIFRDGLRQNLERYHPYYQVCGEAAGEDDLMQLLKNGTQPDILIMDNILQGKSGIAITASLKQGDFKNIKVIILSGLISSSIGRSDYEYVLDAIEAGADGYLLKDCGIEQIGRAVEEVMQGGGFCLGETFNIKEATRVIINNQKKLISILKKEHNFGLTQREIQMIQLLSQGLSAKEIASKMCITEDVVTSFKDNIKRKLKETYDIDIKNMVEMVVWAIKNKVIAI
ncbi:MAG: hypothetical protein A2W93_08720 [Bacteroidetes bacterium GWF2_43_63]|nr:MAG: hypothetical protein A2W94_03075 [Bacteroidetes bacterium GWE2_42_42]OFY55214.1 MAG: hypothetical protein A2W93_08720 [Bacteroidetes bacterium GWF2_43_63]HBG70909.1 hypothetical protein [Bacteroidales bacterium]HCB63327.1 hypothetical protein [Bacteroidales bacterium]HCY23030.1 hypothetical protein [Bacteroidales bacterium]